ncbi:VanZ family protein [Streptacidiphilus albus]|uniref:VanZ family protein n=1 Tax=Streptacidiphilus albus TaxID=105425 RepID=UPI0009DD2F70|nr:VanZ family protein [Streptacidiphilus albus]
MLRGTDERPAGPGGDSGPPAAEAEGVHPGARHLGLLLIAVHLGLVVWLAFQPISAAWMADTNLTPFATVRAELSVGTTHSYLEVLHGLLLLAPLGVLLPLAGGRRDAAALPSFLRTVFAGLLLATGVEVLQSSLTSHLLNVDDVLLAGIGIALAHAALVPAARAALRRRDRARADGAVRTGNFGIAPTAPSPR